MTLRRLLVLSGLYVALLIGLTLAAAEVRAPAKGPATSDLPGGVGAEAQRHPPLRLFTAWLEVFNSGDPQQYASFLKRAFPFRWPAFNDDLALRERTGGYDLHEVDRVSSTQVRGWIAERRSHELVEFELTLEPYLQATTSGPPPPARPYRINALDLRGGSAPPTILWQAPSQPQPGFIPPP